ncbi:cell adhesion protein [Bacillus cereus]
MEENKIEGDEMATIGQVLKTPELGWRRYDCNSQNFSLFDTDFDLSSSDRFYSGITNGQYIRFKFFGKQLRVIAEVSNLPGQVSISIDGNKDYFSLNSKADENYVLKYEKQFTEQAIRECIIKIENNNISFHRFNAFDIDSSGYLIDFMRKVSLYKKEAGKIFIEDFDSINPEWIISPSESFSIAARKGFIRLNHTADKDVMLLINKPQGNIAIQVIADYTPDVEGDKGGLIIYQNADSKIEFLESHSINSSKEHREWLATSTGEQWDFYSKVDATFDYADSDKLEATKIGVVLKKGVADAYKPLDINRIIITSGHKLKLRQLFPNNRVILRDENGTTLSINQVGKLNTGIDINLPSLEFKGTIEVYDEQNSLIAEKKALFYGGDIYNMGSPLKIIMDSKELNDTDPTNLGNMIEGKRIIKMMVQNENSVAVHNLKISIEQYMEKVGYTWADISLNKSNWEDQITLGTLSANSYSEFWVLVTKDLNYIGFEPILFNIKLQHD